MSTNYTGNPTATQAPSGAPEAGGVPVARLPADADALNAASVAQLAKVAVDWITFGLSPFAKVAAYTQQIIKWKFAGLHTRALVDHLGFPGGRIIAADEYWTRAIFKSGASGVANLEAFESGWHYRAVQGSGLGSVSGNIPDAVSPRFPYLAVKSGDTAGDYTLVDHAAYCMFQDDNHVVFECEGQPESIGTNIHAYLGLAPLFQIPNGVLGTQFAVFDRSLAAEPNWMARTGGGAGVTSTDTGIPVTTSWVRLRVEWHGNLIAEGGAGAAVRFYINGTLVATHTTNIPATTAAACPHVSVWNSNGISGVGNRLFVGPVKLRANLYGADVV